MEGLFAPFLYRDFVFSVDTTQAGSASDHMILPFVTGGTYNCNIDWGDGNDDDITAWNDAALDHTYSVGGTYVIRISGQCEEMLFLNGGDKAKIGEIFQFGDGFKMGSAGSFWGCSNLTISATDPCNFSTTDALDAAFLNCTSLSTAQV